MPDFLQLGANNHLIDGQLAENEKLQFIFNNSTALGVIGGGSVVTENGNFTFNLGPGEDQIYHKITAIGIKNATAEFEKYEMD